MAFFDAFSSKVMVYGRDHPSRYKHSDELNVLYYLNVLGDGLLGNASDLSMNNASVRLRSPEGCCDLQAQVQLTKPVLFKEHESVVRCKICMAGMSKVLLPVSSLCRSMQTLLLGQEAFCLSSVVICKIEST